MDDVVFRLARQDLGAAAPKWASIRNYSDPAVDGTLPVAQQEDCASKIYAKYGYWTSVLGAIATWSAIAGFEEAGLGDCERLIVRIAIVVMIVIMAVVMMIVISPASVLGRPAPVVTSRKNGGDRNGNCGRTERARLPRWLSADFHEEHPGYGRAARKEARLIR
jgi:hypothetical protein